MSTFSSSSGGGGGNSSCDGPKSGPVKKVPAWLNSKAWSSTSTSTSSASRARGTSSSSNAGVNTGAPSPTGPTTAGERNSGSTHGLPNNVEGWDKASEDGEGGRLRGSGDAPFSPSAATAAAAGPASPPSPFSSNTIGSPSFWSDWHETGGGTATAAPEASEKAEALAGSVAAAAAAFPRGPPQGGSSSVSQQQQRVPASAVLDGPLTLPSAAAAAAAAAAPTAGPAAAGSAPGGAAIGDPLLPPAYDSVVMSTARVALSDSEPGSAAQLPPVSPRSAVPTATTPRRSSIPGHAVARTSLASLSPRSSSTPGSRTSSTTTSSAAPLPLPLTSPSPAFTSHSKLLAAATAADGIRSIPAGTGPSAATDMVPPPPPEQQHGQARRASASSAAAVVPPVVARAGSLIADPFTLATASEADHAYERRVHRFYAEISRSKVNIVELRRLAMHGIPDEAGLRATTWKLLLGYLPLQRDDWDAELAKKRAQYHHFTEELLLNPTVVERRKSRSARISQRQRLAAWDSAEDPRATQSAAPMPPPSPSSSSSCMAPTRTSSSCASAGGRDSSSVMRGEGRGSTAECSDDDDEQEEELEEEGEVSRRATSAAGCADELRGEDVSMDDHPLNSKPTSVWHQYFQDTEISEQIERDVKRTHPEMPFFTKEDGSFTPIQTAMCRLLLIFAKLNPGIRYVQGMNEVLAPIIYVFMNDSDPDAVANAEADSFFCFVAVLSDFRDFFCQQLDNSVVGIRSAIARLSDLLRQHDEELWRSLVHGCKLDPQYYAFRWITLLLTQEFGFPQILRIWDALLSSPDGPMEMLLRICCSMMVCVRELLLAGDFTTNLKLLQRYPRVDVEVILRTADRLRVITA